MSHSSALVFIEIHFDSDADGVIIADGWYTYEEGVKALVDATAVLSGKLAATHKNARRWWTPEQAALAAVAVLAVLGGIAYMFYRGIF